MSELTSPGVDRRARESAFLGQSRILRMIKPSSQIHPVCLCGGLEIVAFFNDMDTYNIPRWHTQLTRTKDGQQHLDIGRLDANLCERQAILRQVSRGQFT